jgi:hypothetical protein
MARSRQLSLLPYPAPPHACAKRLDVSVARPHPGVLSFVYTLVAVMERVRVPAPRAAVRADELWRHTCFEAFLKLADEGSYRELNFSPSGEWAAYRFNAYRAGMVLDTEQSAPQLEVRASGDALTLDASVRLPPALATASAIALALAAVVESVDGTLSYWALRHPEARPDFHHPDSFLLELAR